MKKLFTSESVCSGHPDKLCDLISDTILDEYLKLDETSRVACEVAAGKNTIFITGEITSNKELDIEQTVRETIKSIGYFGDTDIDYKTCKIIINLSKQSPDIERGTNDEVGGAGDQGMMFGYACRETEEYMPLGITLAHKLTSRLEEARKTERIKGIGADGKAQVTVEYENDKVKRVDTILISIQHKENKKIEELKEEVKKEIIESVVPKELMDENTKILINPTGRFVIGGPLGDSGLTGRKIIVDTYGGYARHGGGAFSGKDGTKVDRSGAYMARWVAKNIVANHYAEKCEIQLSYAIGIKEPISININTYNTNIIPEEEIVKMILDTFDFTPQGIIKELNLRTPLFTKTTNYGHFGKKELPWERIINFSSNKKV